MSWTDVFPYFDDSLIADFKKFATPQELAELEEWFGVAKTINPRAGRHLVSTCLFWKHPVKQQGELPPLTRDLMMNARQEGWVTRFSPWEHYVLPLLEGAKLLKQMRPEVVFRVYLAADMEFLVEDFVAADCEVMLMRSSSIRHNPGAMWRFLALEEADRWITITDSDRALEVIHDLERTEQTLATDLGLWRVPYTLRVPWGKDHPGLYRPMSACQLGAKGGHPITLLMKSFVWNALRGSMPDRCTIGTEHTLAVYGAEWPSYGFDEWFLLAAVYPRLAFTGVVTFLSWRRSLSANWLALDIEYVTWANPNSELIHVAADELLNRLEGVDRRPVPKPSRLFTARIKRRTILQGG